MQRLEDLRSDWQASCEPLIEECVTGIASKLPPLRGDPFDRSEIGMMATQAVRDWAEQRLVDHCLDWLQQGKHWPNPETAALPYVRSELAAALSHLPAFQPQLPEPALTLPLRSWVLAAGIGALAGMVPGALLSWMLTGQREMGLVVGGIGGAMGVVTAVGLLAQWSSVRSALTYALSLSAAGAVLGGIWNYWRKQPITGWLRAGLALLAGWFVALLARPSLGWPSPESVLKQIQEELRAHLRHVADLVLGWCWAHPERQPRKSGPTPTPPPPLPESFFRCLGDLYVRVSTAGGATDGLQDLIAVLLQRFEDAGYEWKIVPPGTPFDESMKKDFGSFTRLEPGQTVRTRRPALLRDDHLQMKGDLERA
jgi:hypothetical protein